jgi:hypothetical protein
MTSGQLLNLVLREWLARHEHERPPFGPPPNTPEPPS